MTFLEMKKRLARRMGKNATTLETLTSARFGDALNECHRTILRRPSMTPLRYGVLTFASVADQKLYSLPEEGIARINHITEATNDRKLEYRTPQWLDTLVPDPTAGTPWAWIPRGYSDVHTQPSDASAIYVDSTAAGDTGTAYIEGIVTGGYYRTASVSMTGVTAVAVGSATDFLHITKFYLSAVAVGTVTLHEDASGGTELAKITLGRARARYTTFQLYDTPSAALTYTADVLRGVPDMSNDFDQPLLPEDFHDVLVDMAELKELRKTDDPTRFKMLTADVGRGVRDLETFLTAHPDWRPQFGVPDVERSALGAWFPAGS